MRVAVLVTALWHCPADADAQSQRRAVTDSAAQRPGATFPSARFFVGVSPPRGANPSLPFAGEFALVDSAFVDVDGGTLTVTSGSVYLMESGTGLARFTSERVVDRGVIVTPNPAHTHSLLTDVDDLNATPDGRLSLAGIWEQPSAGYQTDSGAYFWTDGTTATGSRLVSRMRFARVLRPLYENDGLFSFSGRGTTRATRRDIPYEPRRTEWKGELLLVADSVAGTAMVVLFVRNDAGGTRRWQQVVPYANGTFEMRQTRTVGRDLGEELFVGRFTLRNGRLSSTWTRTYAAGTLEESGVGEGARK